MRTGAYCSPAETQHQLPSAAVAWRENLVCPAAESDPFVGGLGITARQLLGKIAVNNYEDWFAGARVHYVHAARTAIQKAVHLLSLIPGDEILVPAYHCGSELDVLLKAGLSVRLFNISRRGELDLDDLRKRVSSATKAIYIIHYFGFAHPLAAVLKLAHSRGLRVIEDCALSTFTRIEGQRIGSAGDIAVYNFPKFLPVPDGGALVINNPGLQGRSWPLRTSDQSVILCGFVRSLRQSLLRNSPKACASLVRAAVRSRSQREPADHAGRVGIPATYYYSPAMTDRKMSWVSAWLMQRTDLTEVCMRRRENYKLLVRRLIGIPGVEPMLKELPDGVCPLCLPAVVSDARQLARRLRALSIPAIAWWSGYHRAALSWEEFPDACHLKDHVIAIPIHHQLSGRQVEFIGGKVDECMTSLP